MREIYVPMKDANEEELKIIIFNANIIRTGSFLEYAQREREFIERRKEEAFYAGLTFPE